MTLRGYTFQLPFGFPSTLTLAPLLFASLALSGCATLAISQSARDWRVLCSHAPIGAGYQYSQEEKLAMNRVGGWALSVEEVNLRCQ
jgi:hypothetical protein